jgi:phosphomannomutase/phosphoglucomutase
MKSRFNPLIFREYDIRGVVGTDLSDEFAERLGLAYTKLISKNVPKANRKNLTVSVGEDCRLSSAKYAQALIAGLIKGGIDVIHLGNCPTPATYFSLYHLQLDGGIMVTASHLPADHNGFKICVGQNAVGGATIQTLRKLIDLNETVKADRIGTVSEFPILPSYFEHLLKDVKPLKTKKVVIDCGNGNGSQVAPELLRKLGAEVIELYCEMDGRFPNHVPDPSVAANLSDLILKVKETHADFGIAIDGDADRMGAVDENGKIIYGDELLVIFSRSILKLHPGATIVSEIKSSFRLYDEIRKHGGKPIMWKTGHSHIEAKMKETKALLGGEMSGHLFFADRNFGYDDAIYAALRIYEIAANHDAPFSTLLEGLPKTVFTPDLRIPCSDQKKFDLVERVVNLLKKSADVAHAKITLIDGIRVDFEDGWGLVRASNTEPVLSLRFEATTVERMHEIKKLFEDTIETAQSSL